MNAFPVNSMSSSKPPGNSQAVIYQNLAEVHKKTNFKFSVSNLVRPNLKKKI